MGWGVGWVWVWDGTLSVQDFVRDGCRGVAIEGGFVGWWWMGLCALCGWCWLMLVAVQWGWVWMWLPQQQMALEQL